MPRNQNSQANVNAGFKFKLHTNSLNPRQSPDFTVMEKPSIVFGGIHSSMVHASKTEAYLTGKQLLDPNVLKTALNILSTDINPEAVSPDLSSEYRKGLALSLFYKFVLAVNPEGVSPQFRSGSSCIERPISTGKQDFDTNQEDWPVSQPIPKVEGVIQCSGEAEYSNDIPSFPGQLWAHLVLSDRAGAEILNIDPSAALALSGVKAFLKASDLAVNTFCPPNEPFMVMKEKVFAESRTDFAGQPVGLIVAETSSLAIKASQLVKISYGKTSDMMLDPMVVIKNNITSRITEMAKQTASNKKDNIVYTIEGDWYVPNQYHNYMECLTCVAVPCEDHLDVYPSCQYPSAVHEAVSNALELPQNQVNVRIRRLGGGYGGKINHGIYTAVITALAANKLNRPIRTVLNLETCMEISGKRYPVWAFYKAGIDENGVVQYLDTKLYQDNGFSPNDPVMAIYTIRFIANCYDYSTWSTTGYGVKTENTSNTWCRAPGSTEAICITENIMDHIAKTTQIDRLEIRIANMAKDNPCLEMLKDLKKSSDYDDRVADISNFNKENRWKKRGISMVPMQFPFDHFGNFYAYASIFKNDGTVAISQSAVEMGQGVNTKAVQVAANVLGIDINLVSVKPIDINHFPNAKVTGGSVGSESAGFAIKKACEELRDRLQPIREQLGDNVSWIDIVREADKQGIDLHAQYMMSQQKDKLDDYMIYGVAVSEIEIDVLTGEHQIVRMDIIQDAGQSLSPEVDVGQVEGSLVMGIGLFTSEELKYDKSSGRLLTTRTWNYKPPGPKDIPADLRITLRKNAPNPLGFMKSKATGEPPLCLSCSVPFAIRHAIEAARRDAGKAQDEWIDLKLPFTREKIWLACSNSAEDYKL